MRKVCFGPRSASFRLFSPYCELSYRPVTRPTHRPPLRINELRWPPVVYPPPASGANSTASLFCGEYCAIAPASALCFHYYTGGVCVIRESFSCHRKQVTFNTAPHRTAPHRQAPQTAQATHAVTSRFLHPVIPPVPPLFYTIYFRVLKRVCNHRDGEYYIKCGLFGHFNKQAGRVHGCICNVKNNGSFFQEWKWYGSPRWSLLLMHLYPAHPNYNSVLRHENIIFTHLFSCCFSSIMMDSYLLFYFTTNVSCRIVWLCCLTPFVLYRKPFRHGSHQRFEHSFCLGAASHSEPRKSQREHLCLPTEHQLSPGDGLSGS